ncbi:MAG: TRAP transporter TatT component family protein, partial [Spirochaetota bacterium]
LIPIILAAGILGSCSIQEMAMDSVADMLGGSAEGGSAFTRDDDPELVGDALPFAIKLYETLLDGSPDHPGLLMATGQLFVMYSNAYVQTPADMLPEGEYEKQEEMYARAKSLYLRGRDYLFRGIEVNHPGFMDALETGEVDPVFAEMTEEDVPYLYWAAAGWFAAIAIDVFDLEMTLRIPKAKALMDRAYEIDPDFGNGTIDDFYILFYASMPQDMGGSAEKARYHYDRAVELSGETNPSPYLSLATTLSIADQDVEEFIGLLTTALAIDVDEDPDNRLANVVAQRKARWYLENIDRFFLEVPEEWEDF